MTLAEHGLIRYTIDQGTLDAMIVSNGAIRAAEGVVVLSARGVEQLSRSVVNNSGTIEATGITKKGGRIFFEGDEVTVASGARIDASSPNGGGQIAVGGSWQRSDPAFREAVKTTVERDAVLRANATDSGDGGTVVAWSDVTNPYSVTLAHGTFEALGGPHGGIGGKIETSGHRLDVRGIKIATSPGGVWLLDPADIAIVGGTQDGDDPDASNSSFAGSPSGTTGSVTSADTLPTTIYESELEGILATTSVSVKATHDITFIGTFSSGLSLKQTSGRTVTLSAGNALNLGSTDISTAGGALTLVAGSGGISGSGSINTAGGLLTLNTSGTTDTLSGVIGGSGAVTKTGSGTLTLSGQSTYTGLTTVSAGTLQIGSGGTTGSLANSALTVDANLVINRSDAEVNLSDLTGAISGTGKVSALIGGNLRVDRGISMTGDTSSITLEAGTEIPAGTVTGGDVTLASAISTGNNGTITIFQGTPNTVALTAMMSGTAGGTKFKSYNTDSSAVSGAQSGTINLFYRSAPTLTITGLTASKNYDGYVSAMGSTFFGGTISGNTDNDGAFAMVNLTLNSAQFGSAHAGTRSLAASYSESNQVIDGWNISGYTSSFSSLSAGTINAKELSSTATIEGVDKVYDGYTVATGSTVSGGSVRGLLNGDTATLGVGGYTLNFDSAHVTSATTIVATGAATVMGFTGGGVGTKDGSAGNAVAGSSTDYRLTQPVVSGVSAHVTTATASLSAGKTYDGNAEFTPLQISVAGIDGETLSLSGAGNATTHSSQVGDNATNYLTSLGSLTLANGSGLASDYSLPSLAGRGPDNAVRIDLATLVLGVAGSRAYDGTTTFDSGLLNISGAAPGDAAKLSLSGSATVSGKDAGRYTSWRTSNLSLSGPAATNYELTGYSVSVSIDPKTVRLSAAKTYDGTTNLTGVVAIETGVAGETLNYTGATVSDRHVATVGKYIDSVTLADNGEVLAGNYRLPSLDATNAPVTISPASLTVTARNDARTFDGTSYHGGNGVTYSGFVRAENESALGGTLTYSGSSQGAVDAGSYLIVPGGITGSDYHISFNEGTLTINPVTLIVIIENLSGTVSKVYDGTDVATLNSSNYRLNGWIGSDRALITKTTGTYDNADADSNKNVTVTLVNSDYNPTGGTNLGNYILPVSLSGNVGQISRAILTVKPDAQSRSYGAENPVFTQSITGYVHGEDATIAGVAGRATGTAMATTTTGVGRYVIDGNVTGLSASNYDFAAAKGTLTITKGRRSTLRWSSRRFPPRRSSSPVPERHLPGTR